MTNQEFEDLLKKMRYWPKEYLQDIGLLVKEIRSLKKENADLRSKLSTTLDLGSTGDYKPQINNGLKGKPGAFRYYALKASITKLDTHGSRGELEQLLRAFKLTENEARKYVEISQPNFETNNNS